MANAIELHDVDKLHPMRRTRAQSLKNLLLSLFRKQESADMVRAADNLSMEVPTGQGLGIIGPNGAGKTTLLRLIAGITQPTNGNITTQGRILPLLELGAGFHPELSGYDNILLQGALLGLEQDEIEECTEAIIDFSGVRPFIHMPVQHYSSGMFMRLGYAISAHMKPDVLLIDEAFSVGDTYFQHKCLDHMETFHDRGGTFLLVSHDLDLVERACDHVLWMDKGQVVEDGTPTQVIHTYKRLMFERSFPKPVPLLHRSQTASGQGARLGNGAIQAEYIELLDEYGSAAHCYDNDGPMRMRIRYRVPDLAELDRITNGSRELTVGLYAQIQRGFGVARADSKEMHHDFVAHPEGGEIIVETDTLDLAPGIYGLSLILYHDDIHCIENTYDLHARTYTFTVREKPAATSVAGLSPPIAWNTQANQRKETSACRTQKPPPANTSSGATRS